MADQNSCLATLQVQGVGALQDDVALLQVIYHIEDGLFLLPDSVYYYYVSGKLALIRQAACFSCRPPGR